MLAAGLTTCRKRTEGDRMVFFGILCDTKRLVILALNPADGRSSLFMSNGAYQCPESGLLQ
ncbi:hypothetical protein SBA5_450052 [Candidatus Sulfotelmatomonas gaucii]|uniref:Uncharacterized protein n=1 Tax=Candidatus Sulfuritelmatomonas gaucii TaxID=2043161 RepID=A0A2N9LMS8_9BACT|nr:hypothetical protein SBA5_450052 [Candidatus Sulfotelmatomonas gaucii]